MMGTWNKPEQTADAIDADGFLHTGDIAEIDPDGFIRLVDRKKDLIVTIEEAHLMSTLKVKRRVAQQQLASLIEEMCRE